MRKGVILVDTQDFCPQTDGRTDFVATARKVIFERFLKFYNTQSLTILSRYNLC